VTKNDDFTDSLLDAGHSMSSIGDGEDFAEFLLDNGNPSVVKNPPPKRNLSNLRKKPNLQKHAPPPASPPPPPPPLKTKSNFWWGLKRVFWVGVASFLLINYCNKQTDDTNKNNDRSAFSILDTFAYLKLGKTIVSAKSLYRDGKYLPQNDLSDSIIVLQIVNSDIHQYYVNKGKMYKSYENYVYDGNDQWRGVGNYLLKYSKRIRFLRIESDFFNNVRESCSFVSVSEEPMDTEIEVRGCDIEYDSDDDLVEIIYIYNSPDDPKIFEGRRGLVYSKSLYPRAFRKQNGRGRVNRRNLEDNNSSIQAEDSDETSSGEPNQRGEFVKGKQSWKASENADNETINSKDETANNSNVKKSFYIGQPYAGGYVFSVNNDMSQGKVYHIPNQEKCKWRKISRLLKVQNENDYFSRCCSWRLPSADELATLFKNISETNFIDGIYWTSSESVNLAVNIGEEKANSDFRDKWKGQLKSMLTVNRLDGQILESTKNQEHFVVFIRDFSFDEN